MTKIRRNWKPMGVAELDAFAANVITKSDGNPALPTPAPPFVAIKTKREAMRAKMDQLSALDTQAKALRNAICDDADELRDLFAVGASYAEACTECDGTKILSLGFDVVGAPSSTPVAMTQVMNLAVTVGDNEGEIDASWDPVDSARVYEVQTAPSPTAPATWTVYGTPQTKSSITLSGLTSGQRTWVRVRAIGAGDSSPGPFSDPAFSMVP